MSKKRTTQELITGWEQIQNDQELVVFIDSLTFPETKLLDRAMEQGQTTWDPPYLLNTAVVA